MQQGQNTNCDVTVVILAGGGSRRMHGKDKGLLPLHGKPLIRHVIGRLAPQTGRLLINCNNNCDSYSDFGYPLQSDTLPGGLGPLAGLLGTMESANSDYILSVPCDTPYLPTDLLARMCHTMQQNRAEVCTVTDGERTHPVILLVSHQLKDNLRQYLMGGGRKVLDWYERQNHCIADFSDQPDAFANINTPEQLQLAEST